MTAIQYAAMIVTYTTAAVAWGFAIMYHTVTAGQWRKSAVGGHIMAFTLVDAAIFTMLTAANLWPYLAAQPWYQWAYVTVVAGIAVVTVWRGIILWKVNRTN